MPVHLNCLEVDLNDGAAGVRDGGLVRARVRGEGISRGAVHDGSMAVSTVCVGGMLVDGMCVRVVLGGVPLLGVVGV